MIWDWAGVIVSATNNSHANQMFSPEFRFRFFRKSSPAIDAIHPTHEQRFMQHRVEMWRTLRRATTLVGIIGGTWFLIARPIERTLSVSKLRELRIQMREEAEKSGLPATLDSTLRPACAIC